MFQTVLRIPHEVAGVPVFGWGWALGAVALAAAVLLALAVLRPALRRDILALAPMLAVLALATAYVLPFLEERGPQGDPLGLPIRGYGVMLLLGIVSGFALTIYRGRRMGFHPDRMLAMLLWMFAIGICGARLFHVIQYWHVVRDPDSLARSLLNALKFNEGGLVVYGSLVGGLAAVVIFCQRERWSMLRVGDVIAPGMVLGLMLGRIGCLLNGCCHGAACPGSSPAVSFPPGTPPYMAQLESGELLGMRLERDDRGLRVVEVQPGPAAELGVEPGDRVLALAGDRDIQYALRTGDERAMLVIQRQRGGNVGWTAGQLPAQSLPTRPAQIYSAVNAGLLCLFLIAWHPYRRRDGELLALLITLYPITRFLLERVRTDEPGRFGTSLTIAQWVSLALLAVAVGLWAWLARRPRRSEASAGAQAAAS